MLTPKRVLLNIASRLKTYPCEKLISMLEQQKRKLEDLKQNSSNDVYEHLCFPIEQKIKLIENELCKREQTVTK